MGGSKSRRKTGALSPHIDWSIEIDTASSPLPLPHPDDDLTTTSDKLYDLQTTVESGKSLARATHWQEVQADATVDTRFATILTEEERIQYIAWRRGRSGPLVFWNTLPRRALSEKQERQYRALTWALNTVYPGEYLSADNVAWFEYNQGQAMPLLHGIVKVKQEGLLYLLGRQLWTRPEIAESQTVSRILAATSPHLARLNARSIQDKELTNEIKASLMLLQNRERWIERKVVAWKHRIDPPLKSSKPPKLSRKSGARALLLKQDVPMKDLSLGLIIDHGKVAVGTLDLRLISLQEDERLNTLVDGLLDLHRRGKLRVQAVDSRSNGLAGPTSAQRGASPACQDTNGHSSHEHSAALVHLHW
jgi:hypothetical protein